MNLSSIFKNEKLNTMQDSILRGLKMGSIFIKRFMSIMLLINMILVSSCSKQVVTQNVSDDIFVTDTFEDTNQYANANNGYTNTVMAFDSGDTFYTDQYYTANIEDFIFDTYSEYINGVYVTVLTPDEYKEAVIQMENGQQLNVNKVIKNIAIGSGAIILTSILLPALAPGLAPRIAIIVSNIVKESLAGAVFDASIQGIVEYISSGDSTQAAYKAIEGGAEGFMWGAIIASAGNSFVEVKRLNQSLVNFSDNADDFSTGKRLTNSGDNIDNVAKSSSTRIASRDEIAQTMIPDDVQTVFKTSPNPTQPPKGYVCHDYPNSTGVLTRKNAVGEPISYSMYTSPAGDSVIVGSDGMKYFVQDEIIVPFEKVKVFKSQKGVGYAGQSYDDGVYYVRKIVYDSNGELVLWEGPIFSSDFDVHLSKDILLKGNTQQFKYCERMLKEWIEKNPEEALQKFGKETLEIFKKNDYWVGNAGYDWHHSEETGTMQLVDQIIHNQSHGNIGRHVHAGGVSIWGRDG
jgi:hypothetical protein